MNGYTLTLQTSTQTAEVYFRLRENYWQESNYLKIRQIFQCRRGGEKV